GNYWPLASAASMSLDPAKFDESYNDFGTHWCATHAWVDYMLDGGDYGTPGADNPSCCPDWDGDGYLDAACGGDDCDDEDDQIYPGADEVCNGVDDDCDGEIDEDFDLDGDGFMSDVCAYIDSEDADCDDEQAVRICVNAKVQRPGVCNAVETILFHRTAAERGLLARTCQALGDQGVQIRGDAACRDLFKAAAPATEADWSTEYLDLVCAVRVVDSLDEAIEHIEKHG
ncbi:MAG: MopE-related protein, partial [Pirellulaceae bacterium]|nr:MopE-related protein [Pirellulaceae bacterium]